MKTDATFGQAVKILNLVEQKEMPCDQLQKLLGSGLLSDLLEANIDVIDRNAFRRLVGLEPTNTLLEPLGTIIVLATEKFVAKENFIVNTGRKAPVKISFVGSNFSEWFLGKVEEPRPETQLRYAKLLKYSVDRPILAELGNTAETTLAEIFQLMLNQSNGEDGTLLTNGYANIFYVRDVNGELRAVDVRWDGGGWYVDADSVGFPFEWHDGYRVFSCNSCSA